MWGEWTHFMKATIGLMRALFTYESSELKMGTVAFKSLNRKSISMTTFGLSFSISFSSSSVGADKAGFASSLWPGMRVESESEVEMASAISPRMALRGWSSESRGKLISRTASTFPDVIHEIGPSVVVEFCRWSMLTPSMRNRVYRKISQRRIYMRKE